MDPHHTARLLAIGRMVVGAVLLAMPSVVTHRLGPDTPVRTVKALARTMGVRDLVLGVGTITALAEGADASRWVRMGALADAVDAVAMASARREVGGVPALGASAVAATAAAVGLRAADELES